MVIGVAFRARGEEATTTVAQRVEQFLSRIARSGPTVNVADDHVQARGTFQLDSDSEDPAARARAFLDEGGALAAFGQRGRCRVTGVSDVNPNGPVVVRFDVYDGDARIDGAGGVLHLQNGDVSYVDVYQPSRTPVSQRAARDAVVPVEQVRATVFERMMALGFDPEDRNIKRLNRAKGRVRADGTPMGFDPAEDLAVELLVPEDGADLVYDVKPITGWRFWVDPHSGQIIRELPPPRVGDWPAR